MSALRSSKVLSAAGLVLGVALAVVIVVILAIGTAIWSFLEPDRAAEFEASAPTCVELSDTRALVVLTISPIDPSRVISVEVDELGIRGGRLSGVATLPAEATFSTLTNDERALMDADLNDGESWIEVESEARAVVLRIDREAGSEVAIERVALWFAYGEPIGVQDLPMNVTWNDRCVAAEG